VAETMIKAGVIMTIAIITGAGNPNDGLLIGFIVQYFYQLYLYRITEIGDPPRSNHNPQKSGCHFCRSSKSGYRRQK
jgi:hypothetical protein